MFRIEMYKLIKLLGHFQGLKGNSYKINEELVKDDLHNNYMVSVSDLFEL